MPAHKDKDRGKPGAVATTDAKEFNSGADLLAHYKHTRLRLMGSLQQQTATPKQIAEKQLAEMMTRQPKKLRVFLLRASFGKEGDPPPTGKQGHAGVKGASRVKRIMQQVSWKYGIPDPMVILKAGRKDPYPRWRGEMAYEIRRQTLLSYPAIGRIFKRDHTTILHGVHKYAKENNLPLPEDAEPEALPKLPKSQRRQGLMVRVSPIHPKRESK